MKSLQLEYQLLLLVFFIFIMISSCNRNKKEEKINIKQQLNTNNINVDSNISKKDYIVRIAFAKGGCEGTCPMESYQIDSSLQVLYFGDRYSRKEGFYIGKIEKDLWDKIVLKVDSFSPDRYEDKYNKGKDDLRMQMVFCYHNKKKKIEGQDNGLPKEFKTLFNWLDFKLRKIKLTATDKALGFETNFQNSDSYEPSKKINKGNL